jgi:hypothetical protein
MRKIILFGSAMSLVGCATSQQGMPLIYGRTQTVGISVAGSVPDQGAHLTIGFSDRNIAIVPTTSPQGERIRGTGEGSNFEDALSVLGQFQANAKASDVSAGLGTFFSTGNAARLLAEGFSCQMAPTQDACTGENGAADGNSAAPQ